jgi:hypothetical protein
MSTRSVTTFHASDARNTARGFRQAALYRHSDGYPAEAGAALVEALQASATTSQACALLLAKQYDSPYSIGGKRPVYELTSKASDHGDLEHEYVAWRAKDGWHIEHSVRMGWGGEVEFSRTTYTLPEFVSLVNRDRAGINQRIEELRAESPGIYANAKGYEMLAEVKS